MKAESRAVISGIGWSPIGRRLGVDPRKLAFDAARAAIADAGLTSGDIDGISSYPGAVGSTPGLSGAGTDDLRTMLGLNLRWHCAGNELPGQLGSVVNAVLAVAAGLASHVLCFRSVWESTAQKMAGDRKSLVKASTRESLSWSKPYGAGYPTFGALAMQRYMYESGATREQFAQLAVVSRANAAGNPDAVFREPMSVEDYLGSRVISDPLCIYDCDVPVDGAMAVIVSRAPGGQSGHVLRINAVGTATGMRPAAEMMWERADLEPRDVDIAEVYDGFSIYAVQWLEALKLVPGNEGGSFLEGGKRIALDGELPVSTGGGQLSAGRVHGYTGLLEACIQLRGLGGRRQVPAGPEVAVVSSGAESFTSCLLITR